MRVRLIRRLGLGMIMFNLGTFDILGLPDPKFSGHLGLG